MITSIILYLSQVQEEQSVAGQTSVAASTTHWDEFVLNKLSNDTADFIVNKHSHGQQRERLQNKVHTRKMPVVGSLNVRVTIN